MLFLVSCDVVNPYSFSITNDSSKIVSYTYGGIPDTLVVSETRNYEVKGTNNGEAPKNVFDENGIASLDTIFISGDYFFKDATPLNLNVINTLPIDITIKADNFIDNKGSTELTIPKNDESTGALIYTKSPKFTSTTNYPIIVERTIVGNEMWVIIR